MQLKTKLLILFYLVIAFGFSASYIFFPSYVHSFDARLHDMFFKMRGIEKSDDAVVIVDIDERSIKELGQWPWERNKIATILQNLSDAKAGIIGMDIVFSEEDKTNPKRLVKQLGLKIENLPDYDKILAQTIATTPTIVGFVFDFSGSNNNEAPQIPAIFIQKHKTHPFLPQAKGVLRSIDIINKSAYSSGFLNNIPDDSGIVRSVPLLIEYDMQLYPSLAFEMYRLGVGAKKVKVHYSDIGVEDIVLHDQKIKVDRFGKMHLNFKGPFRTFKYISAVDVYNNRFDKKDVAGKFVFIGTSAYGLMDLRSTPMDSVIAGVEIQATVLDNLLQNSMLYRPSWIEAYDILSIWVLAFVVIFLLSRLSFGALVAVFIPFFALFVYANYYLFVQEHILLNVVFPLATIVASLMAVLGVNYLFEARQKELVRAKFAKKVSSSVADILIREGDKNILMANDREVSIFFSDIRGFTQISEALDDPKKLIDFLNLYMTPMTEIIVKHSGTIDKFIGDAIMAYWNAPLDVDHHADKAVSSALEQIGSLAKLNEKFAQLQLPHIDIGIGINTGMAVVGEMGSVGRSDYTIIGDNVNLASRLEGLCKVYGAKIVISEFTKAQLTQPFHVRFLDKVRVKGKHKPVEIFEVMLEEDLLAAEYEEAQRSYHAAKFKQALEMFQKLHEQKPLTLYELYIKRCEHFIQDGVKEFDGVFEFHTK